MGKDHMKTQKMRKQNQVGEGKRLFLYRVLFSSQLFAQFFQFVVVHCLGRSVAAVVQHVGVAPLQENGAIFSKSNAAKNQP